MAVEVATTVITALVTVLGAGGLQKILNLYLKNRGAVAKTQSRIDEKNADVQARLLERAFESGRADEEKALTEWRDCERRCNELTAENLLLNQMIKQVQQESSDKIEQVERESKGRIDALSAENRKLTQELAKQRRDIAMLMTLVRNLKSSNVETLKAGAK